MMQIISVSWIPTYLIRTFHADASRVGYLFGNALLVACAGTLFWPFLAERLARRGRLDSILPILLVLVPCAAASFLAAVSAPTLIGSVVMVMFFHTFTNGIVVMPSAVISAIGSPGVRARLVAIHLFVQAVLAYTLGPVLVPFLSQRLFDENLGSAMFTTGLIAMPLSFLLMLSARSPYRAAVGQ
jgi:MFS family permease